VTTSGDPVLVVQLHRPTRQFRARKTMWKKPGGKRIFAHSFQPATSPKALKRIGRTVRRWALHHRSDKSLTELAAMYNPCIRGWIGY
jgi:hypothetical protein